MVGAFNPFTFKVITQKYDPVAIYFIVLGSSLYTIFVYKKCVLPFQWEDSLSSKREESGTCTCMSEVGLSHYGRKRVQSDQ